MPHPLGVAASRPDPTAISPHKITNITGTFNESTSIKANGTHIVLHSTRKLAPDNSGNAEGNHEIFGATSTAAGGED